MADFSAAPHSESIVLRFFPFCKRFASFLLRKNFGGSVLVLFEGGGCGAGRRKGEKLRDFYLFWGSRVARFRFRRVFAAVVWSEKGRLSIFPQKKQKKINFALKKIDFFFGIYYTLKRTAKIAAKFVADMAQVVERVLGKDEVPGSSPGISSSKKRICNLQVRFFASKKPPGYEAHSKVRRLWRRISLPGGFLIRTCRSLQAPLVAQCKVRLTCKAGKTSIAEISCKKT